MVLKNVIKIKKKKKFLNEQEVDDDLNYLFIKFYYWSFPKRRYLGMECKESKTDKGISCAMWYVQKAELMQIYLFVGCRQFSRSVHFHRLCSQIYIYEAYLLKRDSSFQRWLLS